MEKKLILLMVFLVSCTNGYEEPPKVLSDLIDSSEKSSIIDNSVHPVDVPPSGDSALLESLPPSMLMNISNLNLPLQEQTSGVPNGTSPSEDVLLNKPVLPIDAPIFEETAQTVLLTAPHNVAHIREGTLKPADVCTGFIAEALHNLTGAPILVLDEESRDPNFYDDVPFKVNLAEYLALHPDVKLVIDLHGADRTRPFDVDIGDMDGKSLIHDTTVSQQIEATMIKYGIINISHNFFSASHQQTVTKFVANHGVDGVQLEINRRYRCDESEKTEQLVSALEEIIVRFR